MDSVFRATASSYLVPDPQEFGVAQAPKPRIRVTDLMHDESIKYAGTFDSHAKHRNRVTIYKARI